MHIPRRSFILALFMVIPVIATGCGTGETPAATPPASQAFTQTPVSLPTATPGPLPITRITIDGQKDDWAGRSVLLSDPVGDAVSGYLDIGGVYAFVSRDAFYLMAAFEDPSAPFALFDIHFEADGKPLQITWGPGQTGGMMVWDWSSGTSEPIGETRNSQIALADVLEMRIDLEDLQDPAGIALLNFMVMADVPGQGWSAVDACQAADIPPANERDPDRLGSAEEKYRVARLWQLPEPYIAEPVYTSPLIYNGFIARTQDGTIYTAQSFVRDNGVSLVDAERGIVTPILDIPGDILVGAPIGGPGDTLFLGVGTEVWEVHPDGSHDVWGSSPNALPFYYTGDGRLIGASFDGKLVELTPYGTYQELAGGFSGIYDVLVTGDGIILVYDAPSGDIIRVDPDGSKRVLVPAVLPGDGVNFGMDFDGQVYFNPNGLQDLYRLDVDTGRATRIPDAYSPCSQNRGDIVFIEPGKLLLVGNQLSWENLATGESGILVQDFAFTFAADIGPDGALYVGASGCGDQIPARVLRIGDDGTQTALVDNLRGAIMAIGFAADYGLYVASRDEGANHIYYFAPGSRTPLEIPGAPAEEIASMGVDPLSDRLFLSFPGSMTVLEYDRNGFVREHAFQFPEAITEFRLAFGPDGALFGLAGFGISNDDFRGPWVLRLDPDSDGLSVVAELSHKATGVMTAFTVDDKGEIWVIVNPDSNLFHIAADGTVSLFAANLPIDMPAIRVDPSGDIYFTFTGGIYRIYREA